jgi:lysophospholipase L1-like esterase
MTARYGPRAAVRKAAVVLACLLFTAPGAAHAAGPKRLLILGDSLAAGYGLPHAAGFQAQLDPRQTEANLTAILDALAQRHIPVLLTGMYAPPNLGPQYDEEFRAAFDRLGHRPGLIYDPFFLDGVAADRALNQPDGIHPNATGVRHIVARLLPDEAVRRPGATVGPAQPPRRHGRRGARRALGAGGEPARHAALHRRGRGPSG